MVSDLKNGDYGAFDRNPVSGDDKKEGFFPFLKSIVTNRYLVLASLFSVFGVVILVMTVRLQFSNYQNTLSQSSSGVVRQYSQQAPRGDIYDSRGVLLASTTEYNSVMLANASNAIIVGFNVRPDATAQANAERDGVDMRMYRVIYDCIEEIESAMKGMLAPKTREVILGTAEVRDVIRIKSIGNIGGCYVKSGKIQRGAGVRVVRDGIIIADDTIGSLQRFKDSVKEVAEGYECGIGLEKYNDIKEGDIFEVFTIEEYRED